MAITTRCAALISTSLGPSVSRPRYRSPGRRTRGSSMPRSSRRSLAPPRARRNSPATSGFCKPLARSKSHSRRSKLAPRPWPTSAIRCVASGSTHSPGSCSVWSLTPTRPTVCNISSARWTTAPTAGSSFPSRSWLRTRFSFSWRMSCVDWKSIRRASVGAWRTSCRSWRPRN